MCNITQRLTFLKEFNSIHQSKSVSIQFDKRETIFQLSPVELFYFSKIYSVDHGFFLVDNIFKTLEKNIVSSKKYHVYQFNQ